MGPRYVSLLRPLQYSPFPPSEIVRKPFWQPMQLQMPTRYLPSPRHRWEKTWNGPAITEISRAPNSLRVLSLYVGVVFIL